MSNVHSKPINFYPILLIILEKLVVVRNTRKLQIPGGFRNSLKNNYRFREKSVSEIKTHKTFPVRRLNIRVVKKNTILR